MDVDEERMYNFCPNRDIRLVRYGGGRGHRVRKPRVDRVKGQLKICDGQQPFFAVGLGRLKGERGDASR